MHHELAPRPLAQEWPELGHYSITSLAQGVLLHCGSVAAKLL